MMQTKTSHIQFKFFKSNILFYQKYNITINQKKIKTISTTEDNSNILLNKCHYKKLKCSLNGNQTINESIIKTNEINESVILWFKNDLRIDDHPGLIKAIQNYQQIIPFYSLDPELIKGVVDVPGGLKLLYQSLSKLKSNLKQLDSDLIIKRGPTFKTIIDIAKEYNIKTIITEKEIDHKWAMELDTINKELEKNGISLIKWSLSIWNADDYNFNYNVFSKERTSKNNLYEIPTKIMSSINENIELPTFEEFKNILEGAEYEALAKHLKNDPFNRNRDDIELYTELYTKLVEDPIALLKSYFNAFTVNKENSALYKIIKLKENKSIPGLSFTSIFTAPMTLGIISARRIYFEAMNFKLSSGIFDKNNPFVTAAISAAESYDFHHQMAEQLMIKSSNCTPGNSEKRFWKWYGMIGEFSLSKPKLNLRTTLIKAPPLVLVHGFGASSMHWRRNVDALSEAGYEVYCPTLLGYGKAQKPLTIYNGDVLRQNLQDFITNNVKEPVVLVGNSNGGVASALVAATTPHLVKGVILLNPSGPTVPESEYPNDTNYNKSDIKDDIKAEKSISPIWLNIFSFILLTYLKFNAKKTLKSLYPTNPEAADEELANEILRASYDPGAINIIKSIYFLRNPVPLNYMIAKKWKGPTLLIQGILDPLNDAKVRADIIDQTCDNVEVMQIEAGHCPHDEVPDIVNANIIRFMKKHYSDNNQESSDDSYKIKEPLIS